MDRRDFIKVTGTAAAGLLVAGGVATPARAAARTDIGVSVYPFPLSRSRCWPARSGQHGPHGELPDLPRRRPAAAHVPAQRRPGLVGAPPCGGWESPTTELRGHSHRPPADRARPGLRQHRHGRVQDQGRLPRQRAGQCQARATTAGFNTGYLSAYPESFIDRVEARQTVWAPYYTLHKIMAGLLDMHLLAGNAQALTVLTRHGRLGEVPQRPAHPRPSGRTCSTPSSAA